jgi:RimJ/RimL family protein N-acetyltransferase
MVNDKKIKFRLAKFQDADVLLRWRNDSQTRIASRNTKKISLKHHLEWLKDSLLAKNRKIFIVEYNKIPVGTIRADYSGNDTELSWTIAPEMRGKGIGKEMVKLFVTQMHGAIRAEIRVDNEASKRVAEHVGMHIEDKKNGFLIYLGQANDSK